MLTSFLGGIGFAKPFAETLANTTSCNSAITDSFERVPALYWYSFEGKDYLNKQQLYQQIRHNESDYFKEYKNGSKTSLSTIQVLYPFHYKFDPATEDLYGNAKDLLIDEMYGFVIPAYPNSSYWFSHQMSFIENKINEFTTNLTDPNSSIYAGVNYLDYFNPINLGQSPVFQDYYFAYIEDVKARLFVGCTINVVEVTKSSGNIPKYTRSIDNNVGDLDAPLIQLESEKKYNISVTSIDLNPPFVPYNFDLYVKDTSFSPRLNVRNVNLLQNNSLSPYLFDEHVYLGHNLTVEELVVRLKFDKRTSDIDDYYYNRDSYTPSLIPLYKSKDETLQTLNPSTNGSKTNIQLAYIDFTSVNSIRTINVDVYTFQRFESPTVKNLDETTIHPIIQNIQGTFLPEENNSLIDYYNDTPNRRIDFYVNRLPSGVIKHPGIFVRKLEVYRKIGNITEQIFFDSLDRPINHLGSFYTFDTTAQYEFKLGVNSILNELTLRTSGVIAIPEIKLSVYSQSRQLTPELLSGENNTSFYNTKNLRIEINGFYDDGSLKPIDIQIIEIKKGANESVIETPIRGFTATQNGKFNLFLDETITGETFHHRLFKISVKDINNNLISNYFINIDESRDDYALFLKDSAGKDKEIKFFGEISQDETPIIDTNVYPFQESMEVRIISDFEYGQPIVFIDKVRYTFAPVCNLSNLTSSSETSSTSSSETSSESLISSSASNLLNERCSVDFTKLNWKEATKSHNYFDQDHPRNFAVNKDERANDSNKPITKVYSEQYILEVDTEEVKYPGNFQMFIEVIDQHGNVSNNHATTLGLGLTSGITFLPPNSPLNQSINLISLLYIGVPTIFLFIFFTSLRYFPTKNKTNLKKQI